MTHTTDANGVRDHFEREVSFPASDDAVVDAVGDTRIDPPAGDPVAVAAVLEHSEETEYASAIELHETVLSNLGDDHIGRKHYDDRAANPGRSDDVSI